MFDTYHFVFCCLNIVKEIAKSVPINTVNMYINMEAVWTILYRMGYILNEKI